MKKPCLATRRRLESGRARVTAFTALWHVQPRRRAHLVDEPRHRSFDTIISGTSTGYGIQAGPWPRPLHGLRGSGTSRNSRLDAVCSEYVHVERIRACRWTSCLVFSFCSSFNNICFIHLCLRSWSFRDPQRKLPATHRARQQRRAPLCPQLDKK